MQWQAHFGGSEEGMASSSPDLSPPLYHSPCPSPSPSSPEAAGVAAPPFPAVWSREEDKLFESALASLDLGAPDCWESLAESVPGKDAASLKRHFDALVADIELIEAGFIPSPAYPEPEEVLGQPVHSGGDTPRARKDGPRNNAHITTTSSGVASLIPVSGSTSAKAPCSKPSEIERRKGIPWTEEEHKSFLLGLAKFGKGDWRSISRNFVRTRTPTQVASHAQKYFIRLNSIKKDRRRSSIHDITSVNGDAAQFCQGPITGQGISGHSPGSDGHMYGAAVGQPVSGTLCPTVGTPVMISSSGYPGPFLSGASLPRPFVPGTPVGVLPVPYSLAQPVP